MAKKIQTLDTAPIAIGTRRKKATKKYGGYPFSLDFSLSIMTPSRLTISFIGAEMGKDSGVSTDDGTAGGSAPTKNIAAKYKLKQLEEDISAAATKEPTNVYYCGKKFAGFPLKYSIKRSPSGDILTVDYYDASIGYLDNRLVLLNGKDFPANFGATVDADGIVAGAEEGGTEGGNPCPRHFWTLGQEYSQITTGLPINDVACDRNTERTLPTILYSNDDLAKAIDDVTNGIPCSNTDLLKSSGNGGPAHREVYLEAFHGTLRDVLRQWCERMGLSFYWSSEAEDGEGGGGDDAAGNGELVFFEPDETSLSRINTTVRQIMGAANILDRVESRSKDDTFNKAISAYYANEGLADKSGATDFVFVDFLTIPIMGCETAFPDDTFSAREPGDGTFTFPANQAGFALRVNDANWYQLWDSLNLVTVNDDGEKVDPFTLRPWKYHVFNRPLGPAQPRQDGAGNPQAPAPPGFEEFRDYVRLVKAAALGPEFFKAYIYFKALAEDKSALAGQPPLNPPQPVTVEELIEGTGAQINFEGGLENAAGQETEVSGHKNVLDFVLGLLENDIEIRDAAGNPLTEVQIREIAEDDEHTYSQFGPGNVHMVDPNSASLLELIVNMGEINLTGNAPIPGALTVPVVENKALRKIINNASYQMGDDSTQGSPRARPGRSNIKLCNGTVIGADCLTVKFCNPVYTACQQLYQLASQGPQGGCQDSKSFVSIEAVENEDRVQRGFAMGAANQRDFFPDGGDEGTPYIFTYTNKFGNSVITDSITHNHVYEQLKTIAEMCGRLWYSPELITEREYADRVFADEKDEVSWSPKMMDVGDTKLRSTFNAFDPMASEAAGRMGGGGYNNKYSFMLGRVPVIGNYPVDSDPADPAGLEGFNKDRPNNEGQLMGWDEEVAPEPPPDNACDRADPAAGNGEFEDPYNTARPNIEQWVDALAEVTIPGSISVVDCIGIPDMGPAGLGAGMGGAVGAGLGAAFGGTADAHFDLENEIEKNDIGDPVLDEEGNEVEIPGPVVNAQSLNPQLVFIGKEEVDNPAAGAPGEPDKVSRGMWALKTTYSVAKGDFSGGAGYYERQFNNPANVAATEIQINVQNGTRINFPSEPKVIVTDVDGLMGVLTKLVFESRGKWQGGGDDGMTAPTLTFGFPESEGGRRNVFGTSVEAASMENMDSILRANYSTLQRQRRETCCCTDLDEGVLFLLKEENKTVVPEAVKKQVKRLAGATNLPLQNTHNKTLVTDANFVNRQISYSTNLIPIEKLNGDFGAVDAAGMRTAPDEAADELDWIVDQVELPGTFQNTGYRVTPLNSFDTDPRVACKHTETVMYGMKGDKFEAVSFGVPHPNGPREEGNNAANDPKNVLINDEISNCQGLTKWGDPQPAVDARAMQIEFLTPNDTDLEVNTATCGELNSDERDALIAQVQTNLDAFVRKRAFAQKNMASECSVTIPDIELQTAGGSPLSIENQAGGEDTGIPSLQAGLESISVRLDGQGVKVTINVGSRRKTKLLNASRANEWEVVNPRTDNLVRGAPDQV